MTLTKLSKDDFTNIEIIQLNIETTGGDFSRLLKILINFVEIHFFLWYNIKSYERRLNTMALTKCPECGKDVSDKAEVCLNCGYNIAKHFEEIEKENQERIKRENAERREKEEFERRMEKAKLPPKHKVSWYISCICFGAMFLLVLIASMASKSPRKSYEVAVCLIISILFLFILPIFIFRSENKKYKKYYRM